MDQISMTTRYRPAHDVVYRTVDGEAVILSIGSGLYFGLTPVGTVIWELIEQGKALGEILATLAAEYDAREEEIERDLHELTSQLVARGLVALAADSV
jgi:hypothetical protein